MNTFSDTVQAIGVRLSGLSDELLVREFNESLMALLPGFVVVCGTVYDAAGARADADSIISTVPPSADGVPADMAAVAAVIRPTLDINSLRDGYKRIGAIKALTKSKPQGDRQTATLGLIVAARSQLSIDAVGEQMLSLNREICDEHRPDMVAVLSQGVASYGMQFFTDDRIGMMSPPGADFSYVPPILVSLTTTSTKSHALNKLLAFIIGHLAFFAPDRHRPSMNDALDGAPPHASIICAYQYNLAHKLIEVAELPKAIHPLVIDDAKRNELLKIAFQPWQDGGVIVADGKLPLLGILASAGVNLPLNTFPTPRGRQLSAVLPMSGDGFLKMMTRVAKRTKGITVRKETQQFTMSKWLDEDTSSPFGARILMTPLAMRDIVLVDNKRVAHFDEIYQFAMHHLIDLRTTQRQLVHLWDEHVESVGRGEAATYDDAIHVNAPIDQPFYKGVQTLIMDAARVAKKVQKLTGLFNIDIGFLFQKQAQYERGITQIEMSDPHLAAYLRESRKWLEPLRLLRDELEHGTFIPPKMRYTRDGAGIIRVQQPTLQGLPVTEFLSILLSRLNRFVEEVLMWCIQRSLPGPLTLVEIPRSERDPDKLERFKTSVKGQGEQPWVIVYSDDPLDNV